MTIQPDRLGQSKADLAAMIKELRLKSGLSGDRLAQRCHTAEVYRELAAIFPNPHPES